VRVAASRYARDTVTIYHVLQVINPLAVLGRAAVAASTFSREQLLILLSVNSLPRHSVEMFLQCCLAVHYFNPNVRQIAHLAALCLH